MLTVEHVEHVWAKGRAAVEAYFAIYQSYGRAIGTRDAQVMADHNNGARPLKR